MANDTMKQWLLICYRMITIDINIADKLIDAIYEYYCHGNHMSKENEEQMFLLIDKIANRLYSGVLL